MCRLYIYISEHLLGQQSGSNRRTDEEPLCPTPISPTATDGEWPCGLVSCVCVCERVFFCCRLFRVTCRHTGRQPTASSPLLPPPPPSSSSPPSPQGSQRTNIIRNQHGRQLINGKTPECNAQIYYREKCGHVHEHNISGRTPSQKKVTNQDITNGMKQN